MKSRYQSHNLVDENFCSGNEKIKSFKAIIKESLYPNDPTYHSAGSMVIAERTFKAFTKSNGGIEGLIDLMLFYVECGSQFTLDYGDMDEPYYEALETIFEEMLLLLKENNSLMKMYQHRLYAILYETREMGWGYDDQLQDITDTHFPCFLKNNPI